VPAAGAGAGGMDRARRVAAGHGRSMDWGGVRTGPPWGALAAAHPSPIRRRRPALTAHHAEEDHAGSGRAGLVPSWKRASWWDSAAQRFGISGAAGGRGERYGFRHENAA